MKTRKYRINGHGRTMVTLGVNQIPYEVADRVLQAYVDAGWEVFVEEEVFYFMDDGMHSDKSVSMWEPGGRQE